MKKKNLRIGGAAVLVLGGAARIASAQYQTTNFVTSTAPGGSAPGDFVNNVQFGAYGTKSPTIEPVFNTGSVTLAGSGYSDSALALIDSDGTSSGGGVFGMYGNTDATLNFSFLSGTSNGNVQFGMAERIDGSGGNVFGHGSSAPLVSGNYNNYPVYYCNYAGGKLTLMQQGGYAGGGLPGTQLAQQTGISLAGGADTYLLEMSTQGGASPTITVTLSQNGTSVAALSTIGSVAGSYYGCSSTPDLQGEVGFYGGSNNWSGTPFGIQATSFAVNPVTGPATITWNGNNSGSWDTATHNWQSSALYADSDLVIFDDTADGPNFTVDLGGVTFNPGNVTVNNSSNAYSIGNGTIGGNASMVKNGTNTLTLTGANTFSGGTLVNAGTLDVAAATNGLLSGGNVANYASLQFDGTQALSTISGNGTTTVSSTGSLVVTSFTQPNLVNNGAFTLNGTGAVSTAISGTGNMTVSSTSVLTAASFAQTALVNNGTVQINGIGTIGQLTGNGNLTIGNGGSNTVQLVQNALPNSFIHTQQAIAINSGSTLDITNNTLMLNYGSGSTPLAAIQAAVANGTLTSSTISTGGSGQFAVGYADNTELGSVPSGNVEVMFTLGGDANLDGVVNFNDYSSLQNHYNQTGCDWAQGDFNHDGTVNFNDYSILQNNYGQTLAGVVSGASIIQVAAATKFTSRTNGSDVIVGASLAASGLPTFAVNDDDTGQRPVYAPDTFGPNFANESVDGITAVNVTTNGVVPEPASISLLLLGSLPLLLRRRRGIRRR